MEGYCLVIEGCGLFAIFLWMEVMRVVVIEDRSVASRGWWWFMVIEDCGEKAIKSFC
jgi:hypothetical protein